MCAFLLVRGWCVLARHTIRVTHHDGKKLLKPIYWCGRQGMGEFSFLNAQHLALSVGGSIQPCKACVKAIIKELQKELD